MTHSFPTRRVSDLREQGRRGDALAKPRAGRSLAEHIRRQAGLSGAKAGLLREVLDCQAMEDPGILAATIKRLPLVLKSARPIDEAISSAGGVRLEALDDALMLVPGAHAVPAGTFFAGEMLDWEAPRSEEHTSELQSLMRRSYAV